MIFVTRMDHNVARCRTSIQMKKMAVVSVSLSGRCCSSEWGVLYRINKDEGDESLPFLAFRRHLVNTIFLKYAKEGRLFSSYVGIRNIPSNVLYDGAENYQVQSEHRRTQNLFKHLRWSDFE